MMEDWRDDGAQSIQNFQGVEDSHGILYEVAESGNVIRRDAGVRVGYREDGMYPHELRERPTNLADLKRT